MPSWVIKQTIDLQTAPRPDERVTRALMVEGDVQAHIWQVTVTNGGEDYDLSGCQVTGDFILNDGMTVTVLGLVAGNVAQLTFAQECYAVPGPMRGLMRIAEGEKLLTISEQKFIVKDGVTDVVIDPGDVVPNIDQVAAEYANMQAAEASAIAAASAGNLAARALAPYNAFDMCVLLRPTASSATYPNRVVHNGVTYTWDENGNYAITGQATSQSVCNLYHNTTALPFDMEVGRSYRVEYSSTNVLLQIRFKIADVSAETTAYSGKTNGTFTVPEGAVGARIRFTVTDTSVILDETVRPIVLRDTLTNDELNDRIDSECFIDKGAVGSKDETVDLDTLTAPGFYRLTNTRNYINIPFAVSTTAVLEVLTGTSIITQRATNPASGLVYTRQSLGGSLVGRAWKRIGASRNTGTKYIAFGDSVTYGAVWNASVDDKAKNPHRVQTEWQIPSRIADALGFDDFENAGVSGAGYVYASSSGTLVDLIENHYDPNGNADYDTENVNLVTVMGGANDKLRADISLGDVRSTANDGTICGAIKEIIRWFKANHPKIQLVFIQPTPSGFDENLDPWSTRGAGGWSMNDFDEQVSQICLEKHVGYANWRGSTFCDSWAKHCKGYAYGRDNANYTHPVVDLDYCRIGDYIAGKVAAMVNEKPDTDVNVKKYTVNDLRANTYIHLNRDYYYFDMQARFITGDSTAANYSCLLIPVVAGDVVTLRVQAGKGSCKPYALIGSNYLIYETYTDDSTFDGTISIEKNGFIAINVLNSYKKFLCSVTSDVQTAVRDNTRALAPRPNDVLQHFEAYDENDVCRVLKKGPSLMGMIHHWAIIGASFDTGEFNYTIDGAPHTSEIDWYEYSCFELLKRINGIPDLYIYGNGGQNTRDWVRYKQVSERPARTYVYTTGEEEIATTSQGYPYRSGIGPGGGNWSTKLRPDLEAGKRYQAYLINLGSNDINNIYPFHDETELDRGPAYREGSIEDIGTYDKTTDTDTLPAGKSSSDTGDIGLNVVNSYAGYMGAILNRIFAYQPDAIVFLATIRNGFSATEARYVVWKKYNAVLKAIAAETATGGIYEGKKIYILDNGEFGPNYQIEPMTSMWVHAHPNAMGYQYLAWYWNTLIDHAIQTNYLAMTQSHFIGTDKSYT